MKNYLKYFPQIFPVLIIFTVFKSWFLPGLITAGDFWSYSSSLYQNWTIFQYAWSPYLNAGFGGFASPLLWISFNFSLPITIFGKYLGVSWELMERIYYLFPFLIISFISSAFLFRKLISNNLLYLLSAGIFLFNSYILMVVGGGQIAGIGIAYALFPLVLYLFLKTEQIFKEKDIFKISLRSLLAGVIFSVQAVFDIRIAYITITAVFIYWILKLIENNNFKYLIRSFVFLILIPIITFLALHAFWIIPTIIIGKNPVESLGSAYSSLDAVRFFSFAKFEDAISLLHPNWPENIFGKVGFLKPEFLILPILAYLSLLFVSKTKDLRLKTYVLYFALLGLLGAFLAKGANEPFGEIYLWLFNHVPGFVLFRDPTKWYTLIALSYSMLIPFTIFKAYELLKSPQKFQISNFKNQFFNFQNLFLILTSLFLILLIRPAFLGQLSGTFKSVQIPKEYVRLEQFLSSQESFFRTLWVPTQQRFSYYSAKHPAVPAQNFFKTVEYSQIIKKIKTSEGEKLLQEAGVKYVVVPYDSQGEIFLKDRKYNNGIYQKTINEVKQISYLKHANGFGKIAVFEVSNPKDHFWTTSKSLTLKYKYISPVEYKLEIKNARKGDIIIFSESYDVSWIAQSSKFKVQSSKFDNKFNSFVLPADGDYNLKVYYTPQDYVNIGMVISGLTLVLILGALIYFKKRKI